jgi:pseudaminic acid biosynthesis-associated methylase
MSNRKSSATKPVRRRPAKTAFATEQESFWAGEFGDDYTARNRGAQWVASNLALFAKILDRTRNVHSVLELGANIGLNLRALRQLLPAAQLAAVEINQKAIKELEQIQGTTVHHASILDFQPPQKFDLVFIKGVLIHINPDKLADVYDLMFAASQRYLCVAEYYNPSPVAIPYRGHADRLFKRDFAGELLKRHPSLNLVDYGFAYHGDPNFPQDDITWFLLEKTAP